MGIEPTNYTLSLGTCVRYPRKFTVSVADFGPQLDYGPQNVKCLWSWSCSAETIWTLSAITPMYAGSKGSAFYTEALLWSSDRTNRIARHPRTHSPVLIVEGSGRLELLARPSDTGDDKRRPTPFAFDQLF